MENKIIEKIAKRYKVDSVELNKHYCTMLKLNENIRPEDTDILSYLILTLLNREQLYCESLGESLVEFIEKLYSSEDTFKTLGISAYDNYGDALHVMEIIDNLFNQQTPREYLLPLYWETSFSEFCQQKLAQTFGEDGYKIYNLFAKSSSKISELQSWVSDLTKLYEQELNNGNKSFIFVPISIDDIHTSYDNFHQKAEKIYGNITFIELTRYGGMHCLVYKKEWKL